MILPLGPVVKICGLTREKDVHLARDLGAWALGFVFAPSPRRLTPAAARGLIAAARGVPVAPPVGPPVGPAVGLSSPADAPEGRSPYEVGVCVARPGRRPLTVGVFGDVSAREIAWIVEEADLDGVQLHGLAGPRADEVREAVGRRDRPLLVIKALPVRPDEADPEGLASAAATAGEEADIVLLDTRTAGGFGGSGATFLWSLARKAAALVPVLIAGGIGPGNVRAALGESGGWGVDVSSGVELAPGCKDPEAMKGLFAEMGAARRVTPAGRPPEAEPVAGPTRTGRQEAPGKAKTGERQGRPQQGRQGQGRQGQGRQGGPDR